MVSYFYFERLKPYQRAAITASIIALLIFIWLTLVYFVLQKKITAQEARFISATKEQHLLDSCKNECKILLKSINKMKNNIKTQTQYLEKGNTAQSDMATAIEYARQTGLTLKSCKAMEKEKAEPSFDKQPISYEFSGNLNQAVNFCIRLKECRKLLECSEITIAISENNKCDIRCFLAFMLPSKTI